MLNKRGFQALLVVQGLLQCAGSTKFTQTPCDTVTARPGENVTFQYQWKTSPNSVPGEVIFLRDLHVGEFQQDKLLTVLQNKTEPMKNPGIHDRCRTNVTGSWNRSANSVSFTLHNVQQCDARKYEFQLDFDIHNTQSYRVTLIVSAGVARIDNTSGPRTARERQPVVFECGVSGARPIEVTWSKDGRDDNDCTDGEYGEVLQKNTDAGSSSYVISSVELGDEGIYRCTAANKDGKDHYKVKLTIPKYKPEIIQMGSNQSKEYSVGQKTSLTCEAIGNPPPQFRWSRNGVLIMRDSVTPPQGKSILELFLNSTSSFGIYTCQVENSKGKDSYDFTINQIAGTETPPALLNSSPIAPSTETLSALLNLSPIAPTLPVSQASKEDLSFIVWIALGLVPAALLVAAAVCVRRVYKKRKQRNERRNSERFQFEMQEIVVAGRAGNEGGDITGTMVPWKSTSDSQVCSKLNCFTRHNKYFSAEDVNEYASIQDPRLEHSRHGPHPAHARNIDSSYRPPTAPPPPSLIGSYEFPRQNIKIECIIAEGAFGQVGLGRLSHAWGDKPRTVLVAVKMLKADWSLTDRKDLLMELDLMKRLKPHKHVIKMIGCVTTSDPIYVITELAPFGDLLGFLRRSRGLQDSYYNIGNLDQVQRMRTTLSPDELMSFAWQIADGMSYLGSKQIVHRDLAARNVLVGENQTCKVTDFGMARDVHKENIYQRQSGGRIPVKWTALEALLMGKYTTQSDVWSYGIVLYEIFTIGGNPYPEIGPHQLCDLIPKLERGYRMKKPRHLSDEIYSIMTKCWKTSSEERPTFCEICGTIKRLKKLNQTYINLGDYDNKLYVNHDCT